MIKRTTVFLAIIVFQWTNIVFAQAPAVVPPAPAPVVAPTPAEAAIAAEAATRKAMEDELKKRKDVLDVAIAKKSEADAAAEKAKEDVEKAEEMLGPGLAQFNFGLGIGISFLNEDEILEIQIEEGIVRVTESQGIKRGLWFESHYPAFRVFKRGRQGPFFGVQVLDGGKDIISGVALGWMLSLKFKDRNTGFNIGLGVHSSKIKILGNGIQEDQSIPMGVEDVRLRSKDVTGPIVMFSVNIT